MDEEDREVIEASKAHALEIEDRYPPMTERMSLEEFMEQLEVENRENLVQMMSSHLMRQSKYRRPSGRSKKEKKFNLPE